MSGEEDGQSEDEPPEESAMQNKTEIETTNRIISLSKYYPEGTVYFYGFPSGEDSNFFNQVPPWKEEIVAARPLICAGDKLKVITFAPSRDAQSRSILEGALKMNLVDDGRIISFPSEITCRLEGTLRNRAMKKVIKELFGGSRNLIMAQPYLDEDLKDCYQIDPSRTVKLNDKFNNSLHIPEEYLPGKYQIFTNGKDFLNEDYRGPYPCVVKVSSSSSGDGVRICRSLDELIKAKFEFKDVIGRVMVEEYIHEVLNLGIQFGVPFDKTKEIEIIGYNQQFTSETGNYLGGVVFPNKDYLVLSKIYEVLLKQILPKVREMGWYGIGGIDVLVDKENRFYFIDPNFRMTAAFAYVCLARNGEIKRQMISFIGTMQDNGSDFYDDILPIAIPDNNSPLLKMIALVKENNLYKFNAGMYFKNNEEMILNAQKLLELGIESDALTRIVSSQKPIIRSEKPSFSSFISPLNKFLGAA